MTCGLYLIKNKLTGAMYLGQSVHIERRFREHISQNQLWIDKAISKHGVDSFEFKILEELPNNQAILDIEEEFWIDYLGLAKHKNHYNLAKGGKGGTGELLLGSELPESAKELISKKNSGKNNGMYKGVPTISKNGFVNGKQQFALKHNGKIIARSHNKYKLIQIRDSCDWDSINEPKVSIQKAGSNTGKQCWGIYYKKRYLKYTNNYEDAVAYYKIAKHKLEDGDNVEFYKKNLHLVLPTRKKKMLVEEFNNPNYSNKGYVSSKENNLKMSKKMSSTGIYRVSKEVDRFRYRFYEDGKMKSLCSRNLDKLKEKVIKKGLEWIEFSEVDNEVADR